MSIIAQAWPQLPTAVRTARRLMQALNERYAFANEMDRAVCPDGYGSAYLADEEERERKAIVTNIAGKFHVPPLHLELAITKADWDQDGCWFAAVHGKSNNRYARGV